MRFFYFGMIFLLTLLGLFGVFSQGRAFKKIIAFNVFQAGILLFFLGHAFQGNLELSASSLNPLPLALGFILLGVTFALSAVLFALALRLRRQKESLEENEAADGPPS